METSTNSSTLTNDLESLIKGILNHGPNILPNCLADKNIIDQYRSILDSERLDYEIPASAIDQDYWFIPEKYKKMDIFAELYSRCSTEEELNRVQKELDLFEKYNLLTVLKTMFYIVDMLRQHNIVWGVGRGSSVASYVLFLIGIHKVDSIKYNLPIEEFFKGEKNG